MSPGRIHILSPYSGRDSDMLHFSGGPGMEAYSSSSYRPRSDSIFERELAELSVELGKIRSTRDKSGCSCKPTKVDKLSTGKMKSELTAHGMLIGLPSSEVESLSKSDLAIKMKEVLKHCPMCVDARCECVVQGLGCFAEVCGCIGKRGAHSQHCANVFGQVAFNPDAVNEYRREIIATWRTSSSSVTV
jgi:hypothetical protein